MKNYKCKQCNNDFESKKGCKTRQPKFCSKICYAESLKLNKRCKLCDSIIDNKHSVSIKNRVYCSKKCQGDARKGVPLSDEWKSKLSNARKESKKCKGENLYNWRGGKSTQRERIKSSFYKRKHSLKINFDSKYLEKLIYSQENKCFFCEINLSDYKAIEHLTPVTKGGDNENYNLVYSCKSCNSKKRQQTLEEFAIKNKRFDWLDKFDEIYTRTLELL
jgi:hypothetical protein